MNKHQYNQKYTKEEAQKASLEYFKGEELPATGVFLPKYALRDNGDNLVEKDPDDMHRRLAREIYRIEKKYANPLSEEKIYEYFKDFGVLIPQGSPMSAIGDVFRYQTASNCYVIPPAGDSYGGILHTDEELVQILKRRGGVGTDLSSVRPFGVRTSNAARKAEGVTGIMKRYSNSSREVGQLGRVGALMLTLSVKHPDVERFIDIKRDRKLVTGANVSLRVSDEFMHFVEKSKKFTVQWPVDSSTPEISEERDARSIFDKMVDAAWECAEPGVLFWDTAIRRTPSDIYTEEGFGSVSTNPCQPGFAPVIKKTPFGSILTTFLEIEIGDVIWSNSKWTKVKNKIATGIKTVFAFKSKAGIFYGTEDHKIVSNGEKISAKDAEEFDIIAGPNPLEIHHNPQIVMDGLMIGDGSKHLLSKAKVYLTIGKDDYDYFDSEISHLIVGPHPVKKNVAYEVITTLSPEELPPLPERGIPDRFIFADDNTRASFLRGLYSANGSVCGDRITLKSTSLELIEQAQLMLNSLGIVSYITVNKPTEIKWENGTYTSKISWDLNTNCRAQFAKIIGFLQKYKLEKIKDKPENTKKTTYEITSVENLGEMPVYDITVDNDSHTYWTGGVNVSNCGEIILSAYDSCRLMVVNLIPFVEFPFTNKAKFNFEKFKEVAIDAQRIMDDIIDLDIELVDRIINKIKSENQKYSQTELELWKNVKNAAQKGRRTGLGITALGDVIAAMGFKYGNKESIKFTEEIYKTLCIGSYTSSCVMASERGAFPIFNHEKEKGHEFLEQIWKESPEAFEIYKKFGRRNIANLTTAPTGSTSIMAKCWDWFGTTGGIEPAIFIKYTRKRKLTQDDTTTRVDFVDELGDRWHSYDVYHPGVKKFMEVTGKSVEESPYFGATANDIDPVSAVKIQAAGQRWLCHSISKTINVPADVPKDVIAKVFMEAWKSGCKGITVYRDGSRNNVLSDSSSEVKPKVEFLVDEKRPEILSCDIHRIKIKGQDWVCFVGINKDKPWELFTGLEDSILPPNKKLQHGCIVKRGAENKSKYDLYFNKGQDDEVIFKDITSHFKNEEFGSHTRLISSLMRYAPIDFVVEQLQKLDNEDMFSFIKVVSRVLKSYVKDGTKIDKKCPNCKADALFYVEGCPKCLDCGFSKC